MNPSAPVHQDKPSSTELLSNLPEAMALVSGSLWECCATRHLTGVSLCPHQQSPCLEGFFYSTTVLRKAVIPSLQQ